MCTKQHTFFQVNPAKRTCQVCLETQVFCAQCKEYHQVNQICIEKQ